MSTESGESKQNYNDNATNTNDLAIVNLIQMVDAALAESTAIMEEIALHLTTPATESYNGSDHTLLSPHQVIDNHGYDCNDELDNLMHQCAFDPLPISTELIATANLPHISYDLVESSFINECSSTKPSDPLESKNVSQTSGWNNDFVTNRITFPQTLYQLLDDATEQKVDNNIIGWDDNGKSFRVHDRKRFVTEVMPIYFAQTKYASFARQLSLYGYQRIKSNNKYNGSYFHEQFLQGHRDLVNTMHRSIIKAKTTHLPSPSMDLNFDAMNPLGNVPNEASLGAYKTDYDEKDLDSFHAS
jgi:HSF-type DNA-binding